MAILYMDSFRSYPTPDDMLADGGRGGPWTTFNKVITSAAHMLIDNPTWKGDGTSLRAFRINSGNDRIAPQRDFNATSTEVVCGQFVAGSSNEASNPSQSESCNIVLFQNPILSTDTVTNTSSLQTFYGVSIRASSAHLSTNDAVRVFYTIPTNTSGSVNSLQIGTLRPWTRGRHYHVEFKIDHSGPVARIIIYVNGVLELDTTYDRDRINNDMQTTSFRRVMLGGQNIASGSERFPTYSNLVIYTDDAATPFPMGPIDLDTINPTAGQGYDGLRGAPNASDATSVAILPGATLNGTFDDLTANPNGVLAVDMIVRHGSVAGIEPSQITTSARKADGTVAVSTLTTAAPGLPPTHRRVRLNGPLTQADVNGMTFRIVAAG